MATEQCPLTPRELAALRAVASTGGQKVAAQQLGISESTVKNHLATIHHKLGTYKWGQAAVFCVERGWLVDVTTGTDGGDR